MELLEWMSRGGHEAVLAVQDEASGLRAWIALHDTRRGPAYGGIRVWRYRDEEDALLDALRLSRVMTWKCVLAGVPGGGGKTVVLADRLRDRPAAMAVLGERIDELGGRYRAGPDAGFTAADGVALTRRTRWFAHDTASGLRPAGEATAEGALWGLRAALSHVRRGPLPADAEEPPGESLEGVTVAVQGLGSVGLALARRLLEEGARVLGADPDPVRVREAAAAGVQIVDPGAILEAPAEVFAPCALGGTLHDLSIQKLQARIVAGCANNILARGEHAALLRRRGILFVPDFVLNSGALIEGTGHEQSGRTCFDEELRRIGLVTARVLARAEAEDCTTVEAAVAMARELLEAEREAAADGEA